LLDRAGVLITVLRGVLLVAVRIVLGLWILTGPWDSRS
jgi:hypothetical protein